MAEMTDVLGTNTKTITITFDDDIVEDEIPEPCAECEALNFASLCDSCKAHTLTFADAIKKEIVR